MSMHEGVGSFEPLGCFRAERDAPALPLVYVRSRATLGFMCAPALLLVREIFALDHGPELIANRA